MVCHDSDVYDIVLDQGATYIRVIGLKTSAKKPVVLPTVTAKMEIRESVNSTDTYFTLTTENDGISVDNAAGELRLFISAADTASFTPGVYMYDLEIEEVASGDITKILRGNLTVRAEVTR